MAQVWTAEDLVLGRTVAVKMLHPHLAGEAAFVERFRAEARAAARLGHASIVAIFDTVTEGDIEAIVMEHIEGQTLREFLDEHGPMGLPDTAELIGQIAEAIDAAHAAGIVHRDIKPGNIMLCGDGRVKVTDFGIAKALDGGDLTEPGLLLGTAKYLSPEQAAGDDVDGRADIYSLAVVAYECLAGEAPFNEATDTATALARLRKTAPSARLLRPDLPRAADQALLRGLARAPSDRFATTGSFAQALRSGIETAEPSPHVDATQPFGFAAPTPLLVTPAPPPLPPSSGEERPTSANHHEPAEPPTRRKRRWGRGFLVMIVILASLALGLVLIFATSAGKSALDFIGEDSADSETDSNQDASPIDEAGTAPGEGEAESIESVPTPVLIESAAVRATIRDFDPPPGDGAEHPERLFALLDGDPSTVWSTETYSTSEFGQLKTGVGVIVELESPRTLASLVVRSTIDDWAAMVFLTTGDPGDLAAWGPAVDEKSGVNGDGTFDLRNVRAGALLVWITDLGADRRFEIAELELE
jgi:eukaryotic-like serine/threonine-protein kinase